ncbi:Ras GTPase-activating protein raskol [Sergentomyia squamirostris]
MIHTSTPDSTEALSESTKRRSTFYVPLVGAEDNSGVSLDPSINLSGLDWSLSDSMSSTDILSASPSRNSPTSTRYKRYGVVLNRMNTVESDGGDRLESPLSSLSNIPVSCNVIVSEKVKEKSKTLPQNLTQAATFPPKHSFLLKSTPKISLNYSSGNDSSPSGKASSDKKSSSLSFIRRAHSTKLSRSNSLLRSLTHRADSPANIPEDPVKTLDFETLVKILRADNVEDTVREMFFTPEPSTKITIDDDAVHSDTSYEKACRRGSAPATPILNQKQPEAPTSRFTNFFSKRSFRANPLKRTKSVTKLERAKRGPGGLRGSRSHESLLSSHAVMSTIDLSCTGAVGVAPVHQSVLGRKHCFQVRGGPRGERYYSCGSRQERDLWIYSLRKSIAPNADHTRRTDNSLKMWVYEAKGLPAKKKYFCEINLDKTLYGRTSVKLKGDLLFWGEYFDFPDIPDINLITVNVFREGERKKKRDKHTYIGCVKIPIHEITARMFCEDWYPIISEKVDSFGRNTVKDGFPTLRIKCRFQSIDILPLEVYAEFLEYLKEHYKKVCEILEPVIGVKAKEDIGQALVLLMHSQGMAGAFLTDVVALDLLRVGDQRLTFRGNSLATKSMEAFLKLTGEQYLQDTLSTPIAEIISSDRDCEVDPAKATGSLSRQQQALRNAVKVAWSSIADSHKHFPPQLRECFATFRERLQTLNREDMADNLISASIFLRFLCPSILSPNLFNITNELPSARATRNLTLVAKTLQTLANFTRFQAKEGFMEFLNDFLEQEAANMKEFLHLISTRSDEPAQETILDWTGYIDQGKQLSILYTLLSESIAKLSTARQQELQHLLAILDKITTAKEVTVFAQQAGGNQENLANVQNVQCKPGERGMIRGVLTPNSLEKNIFRYNDPTCSPFLNAQHQTNGLQHSQSTSSISSAPVLHQSGVIPVSIQHHIANSTDRLHQQQKANSPVRPSTKAPNAPAGFYYAPKVIGGQPKDTKDFISSGSFRANTLPRNNIIITTNGNHQNVSRIFPNFPY